MIDAEKIAVFASGNGTNFQNILDYFRNNEKIHVIALVTNKPDCRAVQIAREFNVPVVLVDNAFTTLGKPLNVKLASLNVDWIILAGFLKKIPPSLVNNYSNKIINIHPSLLPKFGGKGMYGKYVHKAVLESGEAESGISIHLVNEEYDKGKLLFQASCDIDRHESVDTLAQKIHSLEKEYFPEIILKTITNEL